MKDKLTSREKRRRRRMRAQILAYITLVVLAVAVVAACFLCVNGIIKYVKNYNEKVNRVIEEAESGVAAEIADELDNEAADGEQGADSGPPQAGDGQEAADPLDELVETLLNEMTIEEMVAGMFMVSPESLTGVNTVTQAGDGTKTAIAENPVGGVVYSAKNFKTAEQFTQMLANTKDFSKYPLFMAVKVEPGSDAGYGLAAGAKVSELTDAGQVQEAYGSMAKTLAGYGVNMDMAPVAEIVPQEGSGSPNGKIFGVEDATAATAAPLVNAAVQFMQEYGVSAALQKFPGTQASSKSLEELKNNEFPIYEMAIQNGVDCIMVGNGKAEGITGDDTPCSLSSVVIQDVLRGTLGFGGVVVTDYLNDSAIKGSYSASEAAVAAVQAGADVLLEPADYQEAYEGVLQAVEDGTITKERIHESIYRIYRVKYKYALESEG